MERKSNHKKLVKKEIDLDKKEIIKKKEEDNDLHFIYYWILSENPFFEKKKITKSRFSELFEQIEKEEQKNKRIEK